MDLQPIQFAIGIRSGYSIKSNRSDLINLYPHIEDNGSKTDMILLNTEGVQQISQDLPGRILGLYEFNGIIYIATQYELLYWDGSGFTSISEAVSFANTRVFISDNGTSVMFAGYNCYAYTPEGEIFEDMSIKPGWYPADTVTYLDGYFIFNRHGTGQFFISLLYSTDIDPLDWATGESAPDDTRAVMVAGRQLWIMGTRSTEVWYDSGDPLFPFTRISGAVTDVGIVAANTLGKIHTTILFVGSDYRVYMTNGYTPTPISTAAIELLIDTHDVAQFMAFTYHNNGHYFYVLHLDEDTTVVYDMMTGLWHRRISCVAEEDPVVGGGRWMIDGAINKYDDTIIYGYADRKFYNVSSDIYTEDGVKIRREAVSQPLNPTPNHVTIAEVQVDMEAGGYEDNPISNSQIWIQFSDDDGKTWGNRRISPIGKKGNYKNRARWQRIGQFRDCIAKVVITDPIPIRMLGLWVRS